MNPADLSKAVLARAFKLAKESGIPENNHDAFVVGYLSGELEDAFRACPKKHLEKTERRLSESPQPK